MGLREDELVVGKLGSLPSPQQMYARDGGLPTGWTLADWFNEALHIVFATIENSSITLVSGSYDGRNVAGCKVEKKNSGFYLEIARTVKDLDILVRLLNRGLYNSGWELHLISTDSLVRQIRGSRYKLVPRT